MAAALQIIALEGFPLVQAGEPLLPLISETLKQNNLSLQTGDVLVLAQKIVSKSENRFARLSETEASKEAESLAQQCAKDPRMVQLVLNESSQVIRAKPGVLIVRHKLGHVMANAGLDQSNIGNDSNLFLMLPKDPDASAQKLKSEVATQLGADIGVLICDSFGRPWRMGTTGVCIGCAGIAAIQDQRGEFDLFGKELQVTMPAKGDEIAAAASLVMGEAAEGTPIVLIRGLKISGTGQTSDLIRPLEEDLFT
ncbi:MAG: coenzyme F420-0:L-glutamate ligase [Pseudomonadales bacterium]